MASSKKLCAAVDTALAESLGQDLAADLQEHCAHCQRCSSELSQVRALSGRVQALRAHTQGRSEDMDISVALMGRLAEKPTWQPWRRLGLIGALAVLLFAVYQLRSDSASTLAQLHAPQGATLATASTSTQILGAAITQAVPFSLSTTDTQSAEIRLPKATLRVGASTEVHVRNAHKVHLDSGILGLDSKTEIALHTRDAPETSVRMQGVASIQRQQEGQPMQVLKRHKVIASSAVLAIVLYSGWATISSGDDETRINAPKGVYLDEQGKAHRFDLQKGATADLLAAALGDSYGSGPSADHDEGYQPSGAFWSDAEQVVKFRIRGEAFDADTGHPLDAFELTAVPITSQDFAQRGAVKRSFSSLTDGEFVVDGIGLGTWRVTATRAGYAPVIQTLEIADLRATPYLVIPLSSSGAKLSGRVIDWQGRPVADATIGISDCAESKRQSCNLVTSDINGGFVLDKLPEEEVYSLYAKHDRYGFATSKNLRSVVEDDAGQHITIRLSGVLRIYGQVFKGAKDAPVAGALVAGGGGETRSGAAGDYELVVPLEENPEAHVVSYPGSAPRLAIHSYPEDRSVRPLEWVDAPTHAAQVRIDFHLEMSGASLRGQIRDQKGAPQAGLEVQLMNTNGWMHQRGHQTFPTLAVTDAAGNYRVENIPAEAGYMLRYRRGSADDWSPLGYVNIEEETDVRADFQIGSATIRGRFVHASTGEPMAVADMSCSRLGAERVGAKGVFALAHCYPDGRFEIENLMPGTYELHSKTEWMDSAVKFKSKTVELAEAQVLADVAIEVDGAGARLWRFRILSETNEFLLGAYLRYQVGASSTTSNLNPGDDGVSQQQIDSSIDEIFLEVPGYAPTRLNLKSLDADEVQEVHLSKLEEQ